MSFEHEPFGANRDSSSSSSRGDGGEGEATKTVERQMMVGMNSFGIQEVDHTNDLQVRLEKGASMSIERERVSIEKERVGPGRTLSSFIIFHHQHHC